MSGKAAVLSYDDLRTISEDFLKEKHPSGSLPVPIEAIIEREGIDIAPQAGLTETCDVDAFINHNCKTIFVDGQVYLSPNTYRYRFSLAHELSHTILHQNVIRSLRFNNIVEWKAAISSIPPDDYAWIEFQAHSLGGLILVPTRPLKIEIARLSQRIKATDQQDFIFQLQRGLSDVFEVSTQVIERRLKKEL